MFNNTITTGTTATTYSPDDSLTRAQLAALLHRLEGSPAAPPPIQFPDVVKAWQLTPVGWMLQEGTTTGTSSTTFSPDDMVTRGQLAAFFYRYKGSPQVVIDPTHPAIPACAAQVDGPATTGDLVVVKDTTLIQNHNGSINITADNITLDCAGHTITGTGTDENAGPGIEIQSRTGVTVENCHVTKYFQGVAVHDSTDILLRDSSANSSNEGFRIVTSVVELRNNTANANNNWGYVINEGTAGSKLTGNIANNNGLIGFALDSGALGVEMTGNSANDNGIGIHGGVSISDNIYSANSCSANGTASSTPAGLCS